MGSRSLEQLLRDIVPASNDQIQYMSGMSMELILQINVGYFSTVWFEQSAETIFEWVYVE